MTRDSDGNVRRQLKLEADLMVRDRGRIGIVVGETSVDNLLGFSPAGRPETYKLVGVTGKWSGMRIVKLDGMFGLSQAVSTINADEELVPRQLVARTKVLAHITPAREAVQIDLGFNRGLHDLSPLLIANRVIRNEFMLRSGLVLPAGWRVRGRMEIGSLTGRDETNGRYNSEWSLVRVIGKNSEVYSEYSNLHYTHASQLGYYSPDRVEILAGGLSTEMGTRPVNMSIDVAAGSGHAREHGETYGRWGLSFRVQTDLKWLIRPGHELRVSGEYEYNQFNPAWEFSPSSGWSMTALTISYRWREDVPSAVRRIGKRTARRSDIAR